MAGSGEGECEFERGSNFIFPEFCGLDSNDKWVGQCGASECYGKHNILKNEVLCLQSHQIMNWWDFLDALECYERSAECGHCTRCRWCKYYFKNLLGEAWGLTWNTWRTKDGQIFMAVRFSPHCEWYARRPMVVEPWRHRTPSPEEREAIEQKEEETLFRLKKNMEKDFNFCIFLIF